MVNKSSENNKRFWMICLSFGLSIGISVYILGFLLGAYLDKQFATTPLCTIIGAMLAIASSFARLIKGLHDLDSQPQKAEGEDSKKESGDK